MSEELSVDEIRGTLRDYFGDRPGLDEVRRVRDGDRSGDGVSAGGFDTAGWSTLAAQLGLTGMGAPQAWGGVGLGMHHLVAAVEECGAALYPGPARAAALTGWALRAVDPEQVPAPVAVGVERFLAGDAVPGLCTAEGTSGTPEMADGSVTGRLVAVTHGAVAELVLCTVQTPEGPGVALVRVAGAQARTSVDSVDLSTPLADVVVDRAPAVPLIGPREGEALRTHRTAARLLLAAEQVGGAEGCLAGMVEHAKSRRQFDQLIGSYQAVQHRCSRTAIAITAARALVAAAAGALDAGDTASAEQLGLLARAESADCFNTAADSLVQVLGGIGFTWEHDAHLYFRRARATAVLGGTPDQHRVDAARAGCVDLLVAPAS